MKYVEHGGELSYPAPVVCEGGYFYNFFLEATKENLAALCDRVFNTTSGGEAMYYPLTHVIMVTVGSIPKIYSGTLNVGWSPEKQVIIWLVLAKVKKEGSVLIAERPVLFPVYTMVPDLYSLVSGREVFGFFKSFGWVDLPDDPAVLNPPSLSLDVFGLKKFGPDEEAKRWPLLEFTRRSGSEGTGKTWSGLKELFHDIRPHLWGDEGPVILPGLGFPVSLLGDFLHHAMPLVFLKQFRDVTDDQNAAYQAIVEAPSPIHSLHAELMGEYDFSMAEALASYPLADDLGLKSQKAILSIKVKMDFEIGGGKIIWEAGNNRGKNE
jgi:hypothetical protein